MFLANQYRTLQFYEPVSFNCCKILQPSGRLEGGGRAGSLPPPLGDGLTPSLKVLLICDNNTVLWRHHHQFYLFKHVKHGTQNIQNDCHQWLSGSFRVHQTRFRSELRPGLRWGSLQRSPRLPSWFEGDYF